MPAPAPAHRPRARILLLPAAAVVAAATVVGITAFSAGPDTRSTSASPSGDGSARSDRSASTAPGPSTTPPAASPSTAAPLSTPGAQTIVAGYAAAADHLTSAVDPDLSAVRKVVSGAALQEIEAEQLELQSTGQSIRGRARVSDVRLLSHGRRDGVRTARVSACVDSSEVHRVDSEGRPVAGATVGDQRALNLYDLRQEGEAGWRIVRHTFPADTAC